jgi:superfamily I DNA/RNA helicase
MARLNFLDSLGVVHRALALVGNAENMAPRFRSVLVDEVQDLSQLEVLLLARLQNVEGQPLVKLPDGLFFAGDGAQSIYKRGFSFKSVGVDITTRSFVMKKNYRNSYEILRAAFPLIRDYACADYDEDAMAKPVSPDLASRHTERPRLCRYRNMQDEVTGTVAQILSLLEYGHDPGQIGVISGSPPMRERIGDELRRLGFKAAELRENVDVLSDNVKYSTIESAKGHEFETVFLVGVVDGVVPRKDTPETDLPREASKLYVAMTRARSNLNISYNLEQTGPSRFLTSIQDECDEFRCEGGALVRLA